MGDQTLSQRNHFCSFLALTILPLVTNLYAGDIRGQILVKPQVKPPTVMLSPYARNRYQPPVRAADGVNLPDEKIVVYLDDHPALSTRQTRTDRPVVDQHDLTIVPHTTVTVVGTTIDFYNSDRVYHNIFSLAKPKRFNLGRYPQGEKRSITFDSPGEVEIFCDIHSEMNGVILVLPNAYYDIITSSGEYRIKDVPPGTYNIRVWREKSPGASVTVTITQDQPHGVVDFTL